MPDLVKLSRTDEWRADSYGLLGWYVVLISVIPHSNFSPPASIKLWSLPMRRCIHTFSVHTDSVWALYSTHPQLHTFYLGDRAGWICRVDVTQPAASTGPSETFNPTPSIRRTAGSPGFASTHTPRHSIAGTFNIMDKARGKEAEMELCDAFCVVIGRAGNDENVNG